MARVVKKYHKGEIVFREGDSTRSMYIVGSGSLRLYKKKGNGNVELGVVHRGEVLGEMAFLDGAPRSATVEAIQEAELIEVSNGSDEGLKKLPEWVQILLKSVVKRLRTASNRIKQLETASISYAFDDAGKRNSVYEFMSNHDVLKITTSLLLAGSRNGKKNDDGTITARAGFIQRYAVNILGVHLAKITEMLDLFQKAGVLTVEKKEDRVDIVIKNINFIETFLVWYSEENTKDDTKKQKFPKRSCLALMGIAKHLNEYEVNDKGQAQINMAKILKQETGNQKVSPFSLDDLEPLKKNCLIDDIKIHDSNTMLAWVPAEEVKKLAPIHVVLSLIEELNEKKRNNY